MSIFPIRTFPDPVLTMQASQVAVFDDDLLRLVDDMFATMYDAPGVGLAAPQIGISKQLFVADVGEGPLVMINPEVVAVSGKWKFEEGCLSVPGLRGYVERPSTVQVDYLDEDGQPRRVVAKDFLATVCQHELDHLDGVLYVDRISDPSKFSFSEEFERHHLDDSA